MLSQEFTLARSGCKDKLPALPYRSRALPCGFVTDSSKTIAQQMRWRNQFHWQAFDEIKPLQPSETPGWTAPLLVHGCMRSTTFGCGRSLRKIAFLFLIAVVYAVAVRLTTRVFILWPLRQPMGQHPSKRYSQP